MCFFERRDKRIGQKWAILLKAPWSDEAEHRDTLTWIEMLRLRRSCDMHISHGEWCATSQKTYSHNNCSEMLHQAASIIELVCNGAGRHQGDCQRSAQDFHCANDAPTYFLFLIRGPVRTHQSLYVAVKDHIY